MVYDRKDNDIIILHPESAKLLQPEDVEFLKGKNIVTDGESIHILKEKGYDFGIDTREIILDEALVYLLSIPPIRGWRLSKYHSLAAEERRHMLWTL